MRLFLASLVFSTVAVVAAERGWLEPESHQFRVVASVTPAPGVARREALPPRLPQDTAEPEAVADSQEEALSDGSPFVVHVERADTPDDEAEPPPSFLVRVVCQGTTYEGRTGEEDPSATFANLPEGPCEVEVAEPGWSLGVAEVTIGEDSEITVAVSRPATVAVKVVDGRGRPVAGARLTVTSPDGQPVGEQLRRALPGAVVAQAEPERPPRPVEFVLEEGGGEPVEAAVPMAEEEVPPVDPSWVTLSVPASGELELPRLEGGTFHLTVELGGSTTAVRDVTVMGGQRVEALMVVEKKATLDVLVRGADDASALEVVLRQDALEVPEAALVAPGHFRFEGIEPGEVTAQVMLRGSAVALQPVLLGDGDARRIELSVSVGEVAVSVAGLIAPQLEESRSGRQAKRAGLAVRLDCGEGDGLLTYAAALSRGVATFSEVPTGVRCRASLSERPLAGSVEVVAPGRAQLTVSENQLELVAADARAPLVVTLTGPAGGTSASGVGSVLVSGIAPGRYEVAGRLGDGAVHATIDVSGTAGQRFTLSPANPVCFSAHPVDADTGEDVGASIAAYERAPSGELRAAQGVFITSEDVGTRACFVSDSLAKVVVSAGGYTPVSFTATRADLGEVRLVPHPSVSVGLVDDVTVGGGGGYVVSGQSSRGLGLRTGDQLVAVEGHATAELAWEELADLLGGAPGTPLHVTVRRAEGVRELALLRP